MKQQTNTFDQILSSIFKNGRRYIENGSPVVEDTLLYILVEGTIKDTLSMLKHSASRYSQWKFTITKVPTETNILCPESAKVGTFKIKAMKKSEKHSVGSMPVQGNRKHVEMDIKPLFMNEGFKLYELLLDR